MRTIPALKPRDIGLVTGDYGTGKTTLVGEWVKSLGRGVLWSGPRRMGRPPDYSAFAVVVHSRREMEAAIRKAPFVVWPSPPTSAGMARVLAEFNDFNSVAMQLQNCAVVWDEFQRITQDSKRLSDLPPAAQDVAELGHKEPGNLAKLYVAHRLAQIPLNFGAGAYRVATRPFPGDERSLEPFFGHDGVRRMARFEVGDFAFWSAKTGPLLPLRLRLSTRPHTASLGKPERKEG